MIAESTRRRKGFGARADAIGASLEREMTATPRILLIGTADTKPDELLFLKSCIEGQGARAFVMDVGVMGSPAFTPDIRNVEVAAAAGASLEALIALGDENAAMAKMAAGATRLALEHFQRGTLHGVLALGGTMGTDLALDVTAALPLGIPKFIVTTIAYSHLIPPERLAPDLMMILWAGGLYGLNSICRSILSQAAGAILGACRTGIAPEKRRPRVAVSSLGKSCLNYMTRLTPALAARGYEAVVFHCTGMGGRSLEALVEQGEFAAVFDFALPEIGNELHGSVVSAGPNRLESAGRRGIPQIIAPGASDMIDLQSWKPVPPRYAERLCHAHNRLLASVTTSADERRALAREIARKLAEARGPVAFLLPTRGIHAWDLEGQVMHDRHAQEAYADEFRRAMPANVELHDLDLHINDDAFVDAALAIFDRWVAEGRIPKGSTTP
jgi:uncharacterized protein (UPF0261 family)